MTKCILSLTFFTSLNLAAQKQFIYYFDGELNPVQKEKAAITGRGIKTEKGITVNFSNNQTKKVFNISDYTISFEWEKY